MTENKLHLRGCRQSFQIMGSPQRMRRMIYELEYHFSSDPALCFDICKALIEYTCKNILMFTNIGFSSKWDMPELIKETQKVIKLIPPIGPNDQDTTIIFANIGKSITTLVQYIGELRSKRGLLAHGALDNLIELEETHARFIAQATDALVEFLVSSSRNYWVNFTEKIEYEDNQEFNELLDDSFSVRDDNDGFLGLLGGDGTEIFTLKKSDLLYRLDKDQYLNLLNDYLGEER